MHVGEKGMLVKRLSITVSFKTTYSYHVVHCLTLELYDVLHVKLLLDDGCEITGGDSIFSANQKRKR